MIKTTIDMSFNLLPKIAAQLPKEVDAIVQETGTELRNEIIIRVKTGSKTGRTYRRGNKTHRASAAGESPASDYGYLAGSVHKRKLGQARAKVTVDAEQGLTLEYGGRRMKPRPFVRPAVKKIYPEFINALRNLEGRVKWVR